MLRVGNLTRPEVEPLTIEELVTDRDLRDLVFSHSSLVREPLVGHTLVVATLYPDGIRLHSLGEVELAEIVPPRERPQWYRIRTPETRELYSRRASGYPHITLPIAQYL